MKIHEHDEYPFSALFARLLASPIRLAFRATSLWTAYCRPYARYALCARLCARHAGNLRSPRMAPRIRLAPLFLFYLPLVMDAEKAENREQIIRSPLMFDCECIILAVSSHINNVIFFYNEIGFRFQFQCLNPVA